MEKKPVKIDCGACIEQVQVLALRARRGGPGAQALTAHGRLTFAAPPGVLLPTALLRRRAFHASGRSGGM